MEGLRAGDTGAFDEVYDAYRPRVFAFLLRMSRSRTVAEDLLDETWLRLVRHAPQASPRHTYWTVALHSRAQPVLEPSP